MTANKTTNTTDPSKIVKSDVSFNWKAIWIKFEDVLLKFLPRLGIGILILIAGEILIRIFRRIFLRIMKRSKLDQTMHKFITALIVAIFRIFLIVIVLSYLGVPTTQFVMLLTSLSLGISLALKDSLSNISGGVLLLATKPLKVGDYVTIDSSEGTVRSVSLVFTELVTLDNRVIYVPNSDLASGKIINHFMEPLRRCDLHVSCSYKDDLNKVREVIHELIANNRLALDIPAPIVRVGDYGDPAVIFDVKVWCESSDYEELIYKLNDDLKNLFDERGLKMPYSDEEPDADEEAPQPSSEIADIM